MSAKAIQISVIIPAKDEEARLEKCLKSIETQSSLPRSCYEIIVVDNCSSDRTNEIARKYADIVLICHLKGGYASRNHGAKFANGEILVFVDADAMLSPGLLAKVIICVGSGFVAGACRKIPEGNSIRHKVVWFLYDLVDLLYFNLLGHPYNFFAAFCFVKKSIFLQIDGFDLLDLVHGDHRLRIKSQKYGKIAYIRNEFIIFSTRRFEKIGYFRYWLRTRLKRHFQYPDIR